MKKALIILLILPFLIGCAAQEETGEKLPISEPAPEQPIKLIPSTEVTKMKLTSPAFKDEGKIPGKYTCDGENISPPLNIKDVPANAQTLALLMDDPDAVKPAGKVWDHWIVFNIPVSTAEIAEGKEPEGVPGTGTGGNLNYHGPCPPDAEHRYYFRLYALDTELDLAEGATKEEVKEAMEGHIIEEAVLMGRYERS